MLCDTTKRKFNPLNLLWMIPAGAAAACALFFGLGYLVAWLWKVTLADIFGIKAISFWQAWGLLLLCQILFKANVTQNNSARSRRGAKPMPVEPGPCPPVQQ